MRRSPIGSAGGAQPLYAGYARARSGAPSHMRGARPVAGSWDDVDEVVAVEDELEYNHPSPIGTEDDVVRDPDVIPPAIREAARKELERRRG